MKFSIYDNERKRYLSDEELEGNYYRVEYTGTYTVLGEYIEYFKVNLLTGKIQTYSTYESEYEGTCKIEQDDDRFTLKVDGVLELDHPTSRLVNRLIKQGLDIMDECDKEDKEDEVEEGKMSESHHGGQGDMTYTTLRNNQQAWANKVNREALRLPAEMEDWKKILEAGAKKYGANNWLEADGKNSDEKSMHASLFRHLAKSSANPGSLDEDSGLDHLLNVACRALMLYTRRRKGIVHKEDKR